MLAYTETETEFIMILDHMNEATLLTDTVIDSRTPIEESMIKSFVRDVLKALDYLHTIGIIHADIKLDNILVHKRGHLREAKLCDFGLSMFM